MKNEKIIEMMRESCTITAPDILHRLDFETVDEYKNTVTKPSALGSYVKSAAIYAAACLVILLVLPFVIGKETLQKLPEPGVTNKPIAVTTTESTVEHNETPDQTSIKGEDINKIYNNVDPATLPEKVTVEEVEKIIEAARLAYDDYDVIILSDGSEITTDVKKPDISVDELAYIYKGEPVHEQYKEYFRRLNFIVTDAIFARFSERATYELDTETVEFSPDNVEFYVTFCIMDIDSTGFESAEKIYEAMSDVNSSVYEHDYDAIWFSGVRRGEDDILNITYTEAGDLLNNRILFPTEEEYNILLSVFEDFNDPVDDYSLAIEEEILAATSVRTKEELVERGYDDMTDQYGTNTVLNAFSCETGAILMYVDYASGYNHQSYIEVTVLNELAGITRVNVEIMTEFVTIDMELNVDLSDPIILPEGAEKELRYILNIEDDKPDPDTEISLNMDLFEEYGMTYGELKAKHGNLSEFGAFDGGCHYSLENGYGFYWFYKNLNMDYLVTDPESGVEYIPIDDDEICRGCSRISVKSLFNESFETVSVESIASISGITYLGTEEDGIVTPRAYASSFRCFRYWNNEDVILTIYHENKDMIDLSSEAKFMIHPSKLEAMGILQDNDKK